ncbi:hypothetical protein ACEPPN_009453 [Leptodophora sp. 'Broadleaf-Isolate-01']
MKAYTYAEFLPDNEAIVRARAMTTSIAKDWIYLRDQCQLNGNILLKRWKKKGKVGRTELLKDVEPDIYPYQFCDVRLCHEFVQLVKKESRHDGQSLWDPNVNEGHHRRPHRKTLLLPYINVESLAVEPIKLLHLLHNRTKYSPSLWATYDNSLLDKQWFLGAFTTTYNSGCLSFSGEDYGRWTVWDTQAAHGGSVVGFPRGILILESQQSLMQFLRGVVEKLLCGMIREDSTLQSDHFNKAMSQGFAARSEPAAHQIDSIYLNQPFSAPPLFDVHKLSAVAKLQVAMHGDHLYILQTDPQYMRRYAAQILKGERDANLLQKHKNRSTALELMRAAARFWSWESILEETQKIEALYEKALNNTHPDFPFTVEYKASLGRLEKLLWAESKWRETCIENVLPHRSGFSKDYKFEWFQDDESASCIQMRVDLGTTAVSNFFGDRLEFCLRTLIQDPWQNPELQELVEFQDHSVRRFDPSAIFGILDEHLGDCHRKGLKDELSRLDDVLYQFYTDLSAIHQMTAMLRLHQLTFPKLVLKDTKNVPTGKAWRYLNKEYYQHIEARRKNLDHNHRWVDTIKLTNREEPAHKITADERLGSLFETFIKTPVPKGNRFTQTWLDQSEAEQAALDGFWEGMRERHRSTLTRLEFGSEDIESDLKALSAASTPEHVLEIKRRREEILATIAARAAEQAAKKNRKADKTALQTQWGEDKQQTFEVLPPKTKPKTRGIPDGFVPESNSPPEPEKPQSRITVAVNKRALSVFKAMFPGNNPEDRSKAVDWDTFVHAMAEEGVGFIARHSAGGSAYTFEPNEKSLWFGKGAISFHKPHTEHVIDAVTVMAHGKRMRKWFGWSEETFVLKK